MGDWILSSEATPKATRASVLCRIGPKGAMPHENALSIEALQNGGGGLGAPTYEPRKLPRRHMASRIGSLDCSKFVLAETIQNLPGYSALEGIPLPERPRDNVVLQ